ncbi:MAG: helix-turn-helix domain-containing protein [Bryobacterales bacterium]|nr:helix-turn-helix domain-containing protein [Bryobacterales bacterium]
MGKTLLAQIEGADDRLLSQVYDTASRLLLARRHDLEARLALDRLMLRLGLSQDEAARMLGVSGETVRRWQRGAVKIPMPRAAQLLSMGEALDRLLALFQPERLPLAIRRPAELFDGERALDWILRGRIADAAGRYEIALSYQG